MTLSSKPVAVILFIVIFGGIALSAVMGWWATESTKVPVTFTEGEFAGQANPADIRGSYTFADIAKSFDVTPDVLAQAFDVMGDDPAGFAVKDLEAMYLDSGAEIGTASVRLFVAYYTGLPFDTSGQEIDLPQSAANILLAHADLTDDQIAYLEQHTVETGAIPTAPVAPPTSAEASTSEDYVVRGKTTFGELIGWGVPAEAIEGLIGAPLPDAAMSVKDYVSANGLDFETLKPALQAEVDRVRP